MAAPGSDLPAAITGSVGLLLRRAAADCQVAFAAALGPLQLAPRPAAVLLTLASGPVPQHTIARLHGIDRSTMVLVADDLESRGLIERTPDPADRRAHRLTLTKPGRAAARAVAAKLKQSERQALAALSDRQRKQLHLALKALARAAAAAAG